MEYRPFVTVIMSVYNNGPYLKKAIDSVLSQTYSNFEFIITDDCSSDDSLSIIEEYSIRDERIKIIKNEKNLGLTRSLNNMIKIAKGDIIARMDGDDICLNKRFEKQISVFEEKNVDVVFSNTNIIDFNGEYVCKSYRPSKLSTILKVIKLHNYIPHPTVMFKKDLIKKYGDYSEAAYKCEDQELWIRLRDNKVRFHYIDKPLLNYRINPNSVRKSSSSKYYKIASICIINKNRLKALEYLKHLSLKEKSLTLIKLILPREMIYIECFA